MKSKPNKQSAGILLYRFNDQLPEILLAHPGGPFWKNKDGGAWSIVKGEFTGEEKPLVAAIREFKEETGIEVKGDFLTLSPIKQKNGKTVFAFALEKDIDPTSIVCNTFELEWPPHSGKKQQFPEIDRVAWFSVPEAKEKINPAQAALIDELLKSV